jgi:hypothetical protein
MKSSHTHTLDKICKRDGKTKFYLCEWWKNEKDGKTNILLTDQFCSLGFSMTETKIFREIVD